MILSVLYIRVLQFFRLLFGIGLFRSIFLFGLAFFAGFIMYKQSELLPNAHYVALTQIGLLLTVQIRRKDKWFVMHHSDNYYSILWIEYLILSLPVLIILGLYTQWLSVLIVIAGILLSPFIKIKPIKRSLNSKLQEMIPDKAFEWKAGVRKAFFLIAAIWIIAIATSFFTGSIPIALLIMGLIPLGFYEMGEPHKMVVFFEKTPGKFLFEKIKYNFILFSTLTLPLVLIFVIIHSEFWHIPVIEWLLLSTLHPYYILAKYAFYEPNSKSSAATTFGAFGSIGILVPFLIPAVWILSVYFYYKAVDNLNIYLDDFN